jgi:mRNA-degrading endonuclease RelE of RelBE toxin-antitoxin system
MARPFTQLLPALEFVETPVFSSFVKRDLGEEGLRALQADLLEKPELAPVIPGSGGARKLRWATPGKGKRGGFRIIYYLALPDQKCFLLLGFKKGEQENLTPEQTKSLREYIKGHLT